MSKQLSKTRKEQGQSLGEVALFLALVVIVSIIALQLLGVNVSGALTTVANAI